MTAPDIRALLERHWSDITNQEIVHEIYHDDAVLEFPQSGERLIGKTTIRAMRDAYPARLTFAIERMRGRDELWVTEGTITYDNGPPVRTVTIMEFAGPLVMRETIYFAEPFDPPTWRAPWVEPPG